MISLTHPRSLLTSSPLERNVVAAQRPAATCAPSAPGTSAWSREAQGPAMARLANRGLRGCFGVSPKIGLDPEVFPA